MLQLQVTDVLCQPLSSASVLVESATSVFSKAVVLRQTPFAVHEYVPDVRFLSVTDLFDVGHLLLVAMATFRVLKFCF